MDFSSWQGVLTTLLSLAMVTLIGVGVRLVMMQTIQQRRERMNRQINERLKTLIAAYRTLGGSFTGELTVDPTHLRELRQSPAQAAQDAQTAQADGDMAGLAGLAEARSSDRSRRVRDAVEAALSDILLLGTEEHCRLAGRAAADMAAGRPIHTADLVISLRNFIRAALDLGPVPDDVAIPLQGPTRAQGGAGRGRGDGDKAGGRGGNGGGGAAGADGGGGGAGMAMGMGLGSGHKGSNDPDHPA
jgi:uncharacterized membrane protein YgcG